MGDMESTIKAAARELVCTHRMERLSETEILYQSILRRHFARLATERDEARDAIERFRAMAFLPRGTAPDAIAEHYNTVLRGYGFPESKDAAMRELQRIGWQGIESRIAEIERERDEALAHGDKLASRNRTLAEHLAKREQGIDGLCMGIARLISRNAAIVKAVEGLKGQIESVRDFLSLLPPNLFDHVFASRPVPPILEQLDAALASAEAVGKEAG